MATVNGVKISLDRMYDRTDEVYDERKRAHEKHGDDSIEAISASDPRWLAILVEEGGEAIEEAVVNLMFASLLGKRLGNVAHTQTHTAADSDEAEKPERLKKELKQIIGVCHAWLERIEDAETRGVEPTVEVGGEVMPQSEYYRRRAAGEWPEHPLPPSDWNGHTPSEPETDPSV